MAEVKKKKTVSKKKPVAKKKTVYRPKTNLAKLFKNRNKKKWSNLKELEVEIIKYLDTCWETHDMQIGTGRAARWEKVEMFIASKGLFRAHLGLTRQNIYDWGVRDNIENQTYAYAIADAEEIIKEQLKEQVQRLNKREYTDAIRWLLATTWHEWDKESTKEKLKAMTESAPKIDTSESAAVLNEYFEKIKGDIVNET